MNIVQQPENISFCGNLNNFVITELTGNLTFKLYLDSTLVVDEVYSPENGRVKIQCEKVIDELLSLVIPAYDSDLYIQGNGARKFRAVIGSTSFEFTVVKGGIGDVSETPGVFMKTQWLTLQPQVKHVTVHQPEFLSYFSIVSSKVKVKAYFADSDEEKYIGNITAGNLYTINVAWARVSQQFTKPVGFYDVWVEDMNGNRLTYIQRYVLTEENEEANLYMFENTLGGIDSIIFTGKFTDKIQTESTITTMLDESRDNDIDFAFSFEQNTGFIPSVEYARWIRGFFVSKQRYHVKDIMRRIYIQETDNEYSIGGLNDHVFEFYYSRQTIYDYLIRNNDDLPRLLEFPEVDSLPFLAPRLAEFPIAAIADDLMLPAQYAYEDKWRRISVASILGKAVGDAVGNIDLSKYWSKSEIEVVEQYLMVLGKKIKAVFADDSELWSGHQFADYLNQFLLTISDVEFKSVLTKILTTNEITTPDFVSGLLGSGARLKDNHLELDEITVRKRMNVFQLVIQKVMHQGGILILSPGGTEITSVVDGGTYYKCTFDTKNGKLKQPFVVDDQLLCQSFDEGNTRRYWRRITSVGEDYFNLSKTDCEENSAIPVAGDEVVVLGNRTDVSRQNALILQAVGDDAPYMDTYDDINSFSLDGKLCTREGNLSGIVDEVFGQLGGTGLYAKRVYLRGKFALDTGDEIGEKLDNLEDNLVTVSGRQDTQEGNITEIRTKVEALPGQITQEVSGVIDWTKKEINTAIAETITSIVEEYYLSNSATSLIGGSWVSTSPAWVDGKFTWKRSLITYADNTITTTSPVCVTGATGATGPKGDTGPTGSQGIPGTSQYFHVKYSANSNGNPMVDIPNTYIGTSVTSSVTAPTTYTSYKWVQLKGAQGAKGDQGIKGATGSNGVSSYLHIKYSDNGTTFTANGGETPGAYIGQYVDSIPTDSTTFSAYTWTKVKGDKGDKGDKGATGATGPKGETGPTGSQGIPGTSQYFHVKYSANSNGNPMVDIPNTYIGTSVTSSVTAPTTYTSYKWVQLKGAQGAKGDQGIKGATGSNGVSSYLHIKYSDNGTTFTANGGETPGAYIGQYVDTTSADSTTFSKYTWTKVKGEKGDKGDKGATGATGSKGETGPTGSQGIPGTSQYFHVKYSANSNGNPMVDIPNTYIGTSVTSSVTAPTTYTSYKWVQLKGAQGAKGDQGIKGATGSNGVSSYLHIKYSDNGTTFTANGGETPGAYIGQYVDTMAADSTTFSKYTWTKVKGDAGAKGDKGATGATGAAGKGVKSTVVTYQASTSGTTVPTGTWGSSIPSVAANSYLWTRTIITYTDNATSTSYAIGKMGATGATGATGKGVKSTAVTYQSSTSGTTIPTGTWGSTIPSVAANSYLWTRTIITYTDNTTSTSYSIGKMGATGATGSKGDTGAQGIPGESLHGKMLNRDPEFRKGNNGVSMYNNTSGGNVTVTRIARPSDCPTTSGYCLKIKTAGAASPGFGGFVLSIQSRANAVFIQKIIAKIPVGYTITNASNSMGTGYTDTWLTSRAGTGKYETYLRKVVCGATGSFSSGGHVYLSGSPTPTASAPLEWYLAYCTVFDQTQDEGIDNLLAIAKSELVTGINQNTLGITLYAKQTDFNALGTRVSTTEATIKTQASNIELKVSKNGVVAAINASPETVKISAAKIDLVGKVTFSMLDTNAQSTVNGKITSAQATTIATTQVNTLKNSLGSLAYLSKVEQAQLGTTLIEGGYIKTSLIRTDLILSAGAEIGEFKIGDINGKGGRWLTASNNTMGLSGSQLAFNKSDRNVYIGSHPSEGTGGVPILGYFNIGPTTPTLKSTEKCALYAAAPLHSSYLIKSYALYAECGSVRIVYGGFGGMVRSFSLSGSSATIDCNFLTGSINSATSGMVVRIQPGFEGQRLALLNYSGVGFSIYRNDRNSLSTKIPSECSALLYYTGSTWLPVQVGNLYYT